MGWRRRKNGEEKTLIYQGINPVIENKNRNFSCFLLYSPPLYHQAQTLSVLSILFFLEAEKKSERAREKEKRLNHVVREELFPPYEATHSSRVTKL